MRGRVERPEIALADVDAPHLAIRIQRRVALVGRDVVVDVAQFLSPGPLRDDDIALDADRARRRRRHLAAGDSPRPVGKAVLEQVASEGVGRPSHAGPVPHRIPVVRFEPNTGDLLPHLMTEHAIQLHLAEPVLRCRVGPGGLAAFLV